MSGGWILPRDLVSVQKSVAAVGPLRRSVGRRQSIQASLSTGIENGSLVSAGGALTPSLSDEHPGRQLRNQVIPQQRSL